MNLDFLLVSHTLTIRELLFAYLRLCWLAELSVWKEYKNRPAGTRTHILVCLGSCSVAILEALIWKSTMKQCIK